MQQFDGSYHKWFEGRGPESCLLLSVDDATGNIIGGPSVVETFHAGEDMDLGHNVFSVDVTAGTFSLSNQTRA